MLALLTLIACKDDTDTTDPDPTASTADTGPEVVTDLFTQSMITPVDLLLVVDPHWGPAGTLGTAFEPTWTELLLADPSWQIGILDATETGNKVGLLARSWRTWPPPNNAFDLGSPGSADPRYREVVYTAFELRRDAQQNEDFLRSGASLYVLYVGAAPDGSTGDPIGQTGYDEWLSELLPSAERHLGVITDAAHEDYWKEHVIDASVQVAGSGLNKAVKSAVLEAIGLETSFKLSQEPDQAPEKIEVIYREHATKYKLDDDYEYDAARRTITFLRDVPRPNAIVRVIYTVDAGSTGGAEE